MTEPNPRKRRLDQVANSGIHKPFRSPLKTIPHAANQTPSKLTLHANIIPAPHSSSENENLLAGTLENRNYFPSTATHSSIQIPIAKPLATPLTTRRSFPALYTPASNSPSKRTPSNAHPSLQLAALEKDISTLTQAITILSSTRTTDLQNLIKKWRYITRAAAEELFEVAKDKVASAGGVEGMRAQEVDREARKRDYEDEAREEEVRLAEVELESSDEDGEVEDGAEEGGVCRRENREMRNDCKRELRAQMRAQMRSKQLQVGSNEERSHDQGWQEEEEGMEKKKKRSVWGSESDNGAFTMGLMLRSMNLDPAAVGFDVEEDTWVD